MKKVLFHTLGCKTNQYDSDAMLDALRAGGYTLAGEGETADLVIVNTCTVTAEADRKSRQMLRQAAAAHPGAIVVAAGCYAQRDPAELAAILGVDLVIGNQDRGHILRLVEEAAAGKEPTTHVKDLKNADFEPLELFEGGEHTRANIKVQEGCNRFCTYCIIPHVRGPIRSRPLTDTVREVSRLADLGVREFVLTGIHIASYGLEKPGSPLLIDLLEALDRVPGVERLRLGSLEPSLLTDEFCRRAAQLKTLCPQFHLSLQSGCTATLKRMGRRYTADEFAGYVDTLRKYIPDAALTTDIITGFPGESEEDHAESMAFVEKMAFYRIHVFPYSQRTGTPAAKMKEQVDKAVKRRRAGEMIALGERLMEAAHQKLVGKTVPVLLEEAEQGLMAGYTPDYIRVLVKGAGPEAQGKIVNVQLESYEKENMTGHIVKEDYHG